MYLIVKVDDVDYTVDAEYSYGVAMEIIEALQPIMKYPHTAYIPYWPGSKLPNEI